MLCETQQIVKDGEKSLHQDRLTVNSVWRQFVTTHHLRKYRKLKLTNAHHYCCFTIKKMHSYQQKKFNLNFLRAFHNEIATKANPEKARVDGFMFHGVQSALNLYMLHQKKTPSDYHLSARNLLEIHAWWHQNAFRAKKKNAGHKQWQSLFCAPSCN